MEYIKIFFMIKQQQIVKIHRMLTYIITMNQNQVKKLWKIIFSKLDIDSERLWSNLLLCKQFTTDINVTLKVMALKGVN